VSTNDKLVDALAARDAAIQEARGWKMEAQTANATIAEIYRLVGSKAGNWNGAKPVREALAEHDAQPAPAPVQVDGIAILKRLSRNWAESAQRSREIGERHPNQPWANEMLRDAAQYEQSVYGVGLALAAFAHPPAPAADGAGKLPSPLRFLIEDYEQAAINYGIRGTVECRRDTDNAGVKLRAAIAALRQPVPDAVREFDKLVDFFRNEGYQRFGLNGDDKGWSPAETAIRAMREYMQKETALASQQESRNA
jgi:hypothetical protein